MRRPIILVILLRRHLTPCRAHDRRRRRCYLDRGPDARRPLLGTLVDPRGNRRTVLELCRHCLDRSLPPDLPDRTRLMSKQHRKALFCWLALLLIAALEFAGSFVPLAPSRRPLLLLPAIAMVVLVGVMYMRVHCGAALVRGFALAGLVWL